MEPMLARMSSSATGNLNMSPWRVQSLISKIRHFEYTKPGFSPGTIQNLSFTFEAPTTCGSVIPVTRVSNGCGEVQV